jgi:nucleotide-binding universal stress UspA family protein
MMDGRRRVIVGVSGSVRSVQALRRAAAEALMRDAVLVPVHAWVPPGGDLAEHRFPSPELWGTWRDAAWRRLWDAFDTAFGGMPPDVDVEPVVVRADVPFALVELAGREDDLLVIGAGRRGPLRRLWHARIPRYCIARATCPVLVVPPTALAQEMDRPLHAWLIIHRALTRPSGRANIMDQKGRVHGPFDPLSSTPATARLICPDCASRDTSRTASMFC